MSFFAKGSKTLATLAALALSTTAIGQGGDSFDQVIGGAKAQMLADPGQAKSQALIAQAIAEREPAGAPREAHIATAEWLQAEASLRLNDVRRAAPLIDSALRRLRHDRPSKLRGDLMMTRGGVNSAAANVAGALADYQTAYELFRTTGETRSQAIALLMIAGIYQEARDFNAALKYQSQALDVYSGDPALSVSMYNNRGDILKELHRYDEARIQFERALSGARAMKSGDLQSRILRNLARLAIEQKDLVTADRRIRQARIASTDGEQQLKALSAEIEIRRGEPLIAKELIEDTFAGQDLKNTELPLREAHYTAYAIYRALGDEPKALAHLQAMKRLDDQVWKLTASTNTALMAARFDSANQEARIAKLKADDAARQLAMAQSEARFQRIIFAGIALGALAVLGLLGFGLFQSRRARVRLSASNTALEKALAAKTEFLATTSHEIRTPLNGILGMTQVLLADNRLDAAARDRVGIVHDAGLTMRGLVDDILDVAKMETGNLTVEALPFDLKAMLEDVTRMWGEQARAKGLAFRLELGDCPRGILGDAGRMRQIVYNLLSNAVKFTAAGSIAVRATCADGRLHLVVSDTGIGIAPAKHEEIFESFKQADGGTTRQFGGTGLGLAIVRNIATAMGGTVAVDSALDHGATFTVDVPFVAAEVAVAPAADDAGGLLIVDRNPIARAMLKAVLEPRAGRVIFAGSCDDAVALLARDRVSQVLIDEATARADDAEPLAQAASVAAATVAPVAILWPAPDDAIRAALARAGVAQVIAKPIAGPALASALYGCNTAAQPVTVAA